MGAYYYNIHWKQRDHKHNIIKNKNNRKKKLN